MKVWRLHHRLSYSSLWLFLATGFSILSFQACRDPEPTLKTEWPTIAQETKPWTRWWWPGSAVTKAGLTAEMEAYQKAGIGGLEITPIYGVHGYEDNFVTYLSPQWMELLQHTLKEAERLGLGIDMATGTGWPFGGPWIGEADACQNLNVKTWTLREGEHLNEKISFEQQPFLRAVGNQIYEVLDNPLQEGKLTQGTRKEPLMQMDAHAIKIDDLVEPVAANKNLQALALDQVKFKKPLPLQALVAYDETGSVVDLTAKVKADGNLDWVAPKGNWTLYGLFQGWHGKMVERAGPGGEGNVIDHFSAQALEHYLNRFDSAFNGHNLKTLRAFFNDSYEVDDARGAADWTPALFEEFKKRKGYDLKEHLPALLAKDTPEKNERVLCDYRETVSELVLNNFTEKWKAWAHDQSAIVRNQAHGSPSNILDLYAVVDIPEIEGTEPLRIKMASSAGNVTGKRLVSSESATWLNEHFESNLADIKDAVDKFLLHGVNHIFYHGTCYSPKEEPWPGWLFYAAVHLNPRNPMWRDFDALNQYISRCQSFLQNSVSDNDVLIYWPIYDRFSTPGEEMVEHFDGIGKQFHNTAFERGAEAMLAHGYSFDYISDRQIQNISLEKGGLKTEGNRIYKTLVLPKCKYIPLPTLQKIFALAEGGATIIVLEGLPEAVAGYVNWEANTEAFQKLTRSFSVEGHRAAIEEEKIKQGKILIGDSLVPLLTHAKIPREGMAAQGISFIRKRGDDQASNTFYFIRNEREEPFEGWLPFNVNAAAAVIYNPMTGASGIAKTRRGRDAQLEVYLELQPAETLIVATGSGDAEGMPYLYREPAGAPEAVGNTWDIVFVAGGPVLPPVVTTSALASWTTLGTPDHQEFSGTVSYRTNFAKPKGNAKRWLLDLGMVKESAKVYVNGKETATLIGPVYQLVVDDSLLKDSNTLEVHVSNLMANRIMGMEKRGVFWKKFYNVNFPSRKPENRKNGLFDAGHWQPRPSGLLGPVTIRPLK